MNSLCRPIRKETEALLAWYDANARQMPWRIGPHEALAGRAANPYHVWLSEIMLQQTQVNTVRQYFIKFIRLWPNITSLGAAEPEEILKAWAGLGYYSRARNLKKCADIVCGELGGVFPTTAKELKKLPGIGEYTSAAIAAIAFGERVGVVDGNVERVMARVHAISTPLPRARLEIQLLVTNLVPRQRPGDFAQAMMDLGATLCTPKNPGCRRCPWQMWCKANSQSRQGEFPVKLPKKIPPVRRSAAFVAMSAGGEILLRKRGEKGMLAGMSEVPSGDWSASRDGATGIDGAPFRANWQHAGVVRHTFTHFQIEMKVYCCLLARRANVDGWWVHRDVIMDEALPTLMKKILGVALGYLEEVE